MRPWRVYLVHALLGGFIGVAVAFYFDAVQVRVVLDKFHRYLSLGGAIKPTYDVYPFLSKWGFINLGPISGGVSLLFAEALKGVISWSIPAWLFAINRTVMAACFQKEMMPIRALFTPLGLVGLTQNMIVVLRWGLWMSPIIDSFLRPMGEPTWYNQDGAIRTLIAIFQDLRLTPEAFRAWSLHVFVLLLAYNSVRILIWLDHMGLRVATLVNLSFLGMDRLEERLARFLAPAATARCIPEAVKRFTTWAPLLIPFYIPRGADWDYAWSQSEAIQRQPHLDLYSVLASLPFWEKLLLAVGAVVVSTAIFTLVRRLRQRFGKHAALAWSLQNAEYQVTLTETGNLFSRVRDRGYDVSRRSYDLLDPDGRTLFVVDPSAAGTPRAWPVIGNYPVEVALASALEATRRRLVIRNVHQDLCLTVDITLAGKSDPAELWTIDVENLTETARSIKVVPYLEWVLNSPEDDRGHRQYNRLFAEMEYEQALHAVLAWDKHSKAMGLLAADIAPEGFLTSRIDFLGRARSLWTPRVLETLAFAPAQDTEAHPTLDPIASLLLGMTLPARGSSRIRLLMGLVKDKKQAIALIARYLGVAEAATVSSARRRTELHPIGHGEIPHGTPQPYSTFSEDGNTLLIHTPFTPRPWDHTLSNMRGQVVSVTNRGLSTSSSVNAQQNRLTPDWPDIVTREVPAEAFYLYDLDSREWFSPTYHPCNDHQATYETEFSVDGTATYHMTRHTLQTELTVFVPPTEPTGIYLLTIRNHGDTVRRLRLAWYCQIVLANQPEHAGPLQIRWDEALHALFFTNPRNRFRTGPVFAAFSRSPEAVVTKRGPFFGAGRSVAHPYFVEQGEPDAADATDDRPVASFVKTLEIPAGHASRFVVLLGQADDRKQAEAVIRAWQSPEAAHAILDETRIWWQSLMHTLRVRTADPAFDHYLNWLKYQALAERIWARRGFYQASGAFGFRDQLQDAVNLMWMDPVLARRQILLHASQQFLEGDVVHWFHRLQDGRTGFSGRTHASDNLLWLAWAVVDYIDATGDTSLLDERTRYLEAEQPFDPLPAGKHGMGFDPLRSAREDTVYRHCMRAIDLVLGRRMGEHGLPLMGTGDWNDGLDEIGSQGRGESVWLGFFLYYILDRMVVLIGAREGRRPEKYYLRRLGELKDTLEETWRGDRYLRAFHDDGTEIGVAGNGIWEIDTLMAAWAVMTGINPERGRVMFETALSILEKETTILLGWPPLREDSKPSLGRSSVYPEGVRENGMYCHGVQWLVRAARILAEQQARAGHADEARRYRETAWRLWGKISPLAHMTPGEIETFGGQPNQQPADMVTTFDPGRMIWNGYTGAAGWMFRQALEGVLGLRLVHGTVRPPTGPGPPAGLEIHEVSRNVLDSPLPGPDSLRPPAQKIGTERPAHWAGPHRASPRGG
jgi:cyclic beta-1,2-glucan synthetase